MPPVTVQDSIRFYSPDPRCQWEELCSLCAAIYASKIAQAFDDWFFEEVHGYLVRSSTVDTSMYLTAQSTDLFGNDRPYDCDDLVDCLLGDIPLRQSPWIGLKRHDPSQLDVMLAVMDKTLKEPLFDHEKNDLLQACKWLQQHCQSPVITMYMEGA